MHTQNDQHFAFIQLFSKCKKASKILVTKDFIAKTKDTEENKLYTLNWIKPILYGYSKVLMQN